MGKAPSEAGKRMAAPTAPPSVELKDVRLVDSTVFQLISGAKLPTVAGTGGELAWGYEGGVNEVRVRADLKLAIRYDTQDEKPAIQVAASFQLIYTVSELPEQLSPETIRTLIESQSLHVVWQFWREYVHSTFSRMGLPAFTVSLRPQFQPNRGESQNVRPKKRARKR